MKPGDRVRYRDGDLYVRAVIEKINEKRITISYRKNGRLRVSRVRPYTLVPWDEWEKTYPDDDGEFTI